MSSLFIEPIASEEVLRESATCEELNEVARFTAEHRRREVLAWRSIVRRKMGESCKIGHDEWGAPIVDTPNRYIGVSHSKEFVAVIISDEPCAVDIESPDRNFEGVAERYMSNEERKLCCEDGWPAKVWCAKEALYKLYRKGGIDFIEDIKISGYDSDSQIIEASLPDRKHIVVRIEHGDGYIVASIG